MISVIVLAKDSARTISWTLKALSAFSDVIVYDTGSKDATLEIATRFPNVRVVQGAFEGFGMTRNRALFHCKHEWILHVDSDEVVSPALSDELHALPLDPHYAYAMIRRNYFWGKCMRSCSGWHPDWVPRLYHKNACLFTESRVHERLDTSRVQVKRLHSPLYHFPYPEISDLLSKMQAYSTLFAEENAGKRKVSFLSVLGHTWFAFIKSYFFKRGIFSGRQGFIISVYQAQTAFYKYLKLLERTDKPPLPDFLKEPHGS